MCKWGSETVVRVPMRASESFTGAFRWADKGVDSCIAPLVQALNAAGIHTANCCCGHGKGPGSIILHDGRTLVIHEKESEMSTNCVRCGVNRRRNPILTCGPCGEIDAAIERLNTIADSVDAPPVDLCDTATKLDNAIERVCRIVRPRIADPFPLGVAPQPSPASEGVERHPLDTCPTCGGETDNGFDREDPPNPYQCSKCDGLDHAAIADALGSSPVAPEDMTNRQRMMAAMACQPHHPSPDPTRERSDLLAFLESAGSGCISGRVSEWPQLVPACRWAAETIAGTLTSDTTRERLERLERLEAKISDLKLSNRVYVSDLRFFHDRCDEAGVPSGDLALRLSWLIDKAAKLAEAERDMEAAALLAERAERAEAERDNFQKLATFYDSVIAKTVEPFLPREDDGSPAYGGKTAALHLCRMRDQLVIKRPHRTPVDPPFPPDRNPIG